MRKRLFRNWQLKVVAIGLAIMVWFSIQREANTDVAVIHNVRVEPVMSEGWRVEAVEPQRVSIEVRGNRETVRSVTSDHFLARPDLSTVSKESETEIILVESDIMSPARIRVLKVYSPKIKVTLGKAMESYF